jgi:hypothetical protein
VKKKQCDFWQLVTAMGKWPEEKIVTTLDQLVTVTKLGHLGTSRGRCLQQRMKIILLF